MASPNDISATVANSLTGEIAALMIGLAVIESANSFTDEDIRVFREILWRAERTISALRWYSVTNGGRAQKDSITQMVLAATSQEGTLW